MSAPTKAPPQGGAAAEALTRGAATETVTSDSTPLAKAPTFSPEIAVYAPITKAEMQPDGSLIIETRITSEAVDDQGEILDYEASKAAVGDWMKWANVREMHQPSAVGVAVGAASDDALKVIDGTVRVVDPTAIAKTMAGVYKGVSVGGRRLAVASEKVGDATVRRVTKWSMSELSLVDRPSNPDAMFVIAKRSESDYIATLQPGEIVALAKNATDDAMSAAGVINWINGLIEGEAGETDQIASLTTARDAMLAFFAAENAEVGTPEDVAETEADEADEPIPVVVVADLSYAQPTGDMAKTTAPAVTPAKTQVTPQVTTLAKSALLGDAEFISKVASSVREQLGGIATEASVEAAKGELAGRLDDLDGRLAEVAKRAAPGGPLRYFDQRGTALPTDSATTPADAADVFRKAAESETDPLVREALNKRAAVELAKDALAHPIPLQRG